MGMQLSEGYTESLNLDGFPLDFIKNPLRSALTFQGAGPERDDFIGSKEEVQKYYVNRNLTNLLISANQQRLLGKKGDKFFNAVCKALSLSAIIKTQY